MGNITQSKKEERSYEKTAFDFPTGCRLHGPLLPVLSLCGCTQQQAPDQAQVSALIEQAEGFTTQIIRR